MIVTRSEKSFQNCPSKKTIMAEIRYRDVPPESMKNAETIQRFFKEKTITGALPLLFKRFLQDQQSIAQLQKRNTELHGAIKKYYDREDHVKSNILTIAQSLRHHIADAKAYTAGIEKVAKSYSPKKR